MTNRSENISFTSWEYVNITLLKKLYFLQNYYIFYCKILYLDNSEVYKRNYLFLFIKYTIFFWVIVLLYHYTIEKLQKIYWKKYFSFQDSFEKKELLDFIIFVKGNDMYRSRWFPTNHHDHLVFIISWRNLNHRLWIGFYHIYNWWS